jgi:prefoldin subunit 5
MNLTKQERTELEAELREIESLIQMLQKRRESLLKQLSDGPAPTAKQAENEKWKSDFRAKYYRQKHL